MKILWPSWSRLRTARSATQRRKTGKTGARTGPKTGAKTGPAETSVLLGITGTTTVPSQDSPVGSNSLVDSEWQINLLPYRAARRTAANRRFAGFMAGTVALGALIVALAHLVMVERLDVQTYRNDYLTQQINVLEKQIADIRGLKNEIEATLSRKRAVEALQANRSLAVQILNQLLNPPDGINYKSIKQVGDTLTIDGFAGSNAQVSQFMNQLEHATPLKSPRLVEIHAIQDSSTTPPRRLNEFTLVVDVQDLAKLAEEQTQATKAKGADHRAFPVRPDAIGGRPPMITGAATQMSSITVPATALVPRRMEGAQVTIPAPTMASMPLALPASPASRVLPALPPIVAPGTAPLATSVHP